MVRCDLSYCLFCKLDLGPDEVSNHGESREHLNAVRRTLFDPDKLSEAVRDARPSDAERQLVCDCRAALKNCLGLNDSTSSIYMTGSVGRGTALRGALDLDVVVVWQSRGKVAAQEIAALLGAPDSGFEVDDKRTNCSRLVFAHFHGIEVDIAPRTSDFDHYKGPLGHVYRFEREPEHHNNLVRLLKGWSRTHVKAPGILFEVVAKEALRLSCGSSLLRGFIWSLCLLQEKEKRSWPDPLDPTNDLSTRMGDRKWRKLQRWCRKTLGMWETRCVQVPSQKLGRIIGRGGEAIRSLEDETKALFLIAKWSGDIHIYAQTQDALSAAEFQLNNLAQGVSHPNSWVFLEPDPSYEHEELDERSVREIFFEPVGLFCYSSASAAVQIATALITSFSVKPVAEQWDVISERRIMRDAAGSRLRQMRVAWVPNHLLKRVIGEFGATIRNMEEETGAKLHVDDDESAVWIYAATEERLKRAMMRIIDVVGSSRSTVVEDDWSML